MVAVCRYLSRITANITSELPKTVAKENRNRKANRPALSFDKSSRYTENNGSSVLKTDDVVEPNVKFNISTRDESKSFGGRAVAFPDAATDAEADEDDDEDEPNEPMFPLPLPIELL